MTNLLGGILQEFFQELLTFLDGDNLWLLTIPVFLLGLRICIKYTTEKREEIENFWDNTTYGMTRSWLERKKEKNRDLFILYFKSVGLLVLVTGILVAISIAIANKKGPNAQKESWEQLPIDSVATDPNH